MGWASGSSLMSSLIKAFNINCSEEEKVNFWIKAIESFQDSDCDTLHECLDVDRYFDAAYYSIDPQHHGYRMGCGSLTFGVSEAIKSSSNPHPPDSKEHGQWQQGFFDGRRETGYSICDWISCQNRGEYGGCSAFDNPKSDCKIAVAVGEVIDKEIFVFEPISADLNDVIELIYEKYIFDSDRAIRHD